MQKLRDGPGSGRQVEIKEADPGAGCEVLGKHWRESVDKSRRALLALLLQGTAQLLTGQGCGSSARDGAVRQARHPGVTKRGCGFQGANFSLWGNVLT